MRVLVRPERLSPRYIPNKLPHRWKEIEFSLGFYQDVKSLIKAGLMRIVQFQGPVGVGKTSVAYHVGKKLERMVRESSLCLKHVYLNLKLESRSRFTLYNSLAKKIDPELGLRSVSAEELLKYTLRYLKFKGLYVFITVDEVDFYVRSASQPQAVFDLTRLNEIFIGEPINVIGVIFISRGSDWRKLLDEATRSSLGRIVLNFKPYTRNQIYDILVYRSRDAFREGALLTEVLEFISDITVENAEGDVRYALDVLLYSAFLAESEGAVRVTLNHVRKVLQHLEPSITSDDILNLNLSEKAVLLALAHLLKSDKKTYVGLEDVWDFYRELSREIKPKKLNRRSFNEVLQSLYHKGLIDFKGLKVGISRIPIEKLLKMLDYIIDMLRYELNVK